MSKQHLSNIINKYQQENNISKISSVATGPTNYQKKKVDIDNIILTQSEAFNLYEKPTTREKHQSFEKYQSTQFYESSQTSTSSKNSQSPKLAQSNKQNNLPQIYKSHEKYNSEKVQNGKNYQKLEEIQTSERISFSSDLEKQVSINENPFDKLELDIADNGLFAVPDNDPKSEVAPQRLNIPLAAYGGRTSNASFVSSCGGRMSNASFISGCREAVMEDNEEAGDDMDELSMANPGSVEHFQRMFYPDIPCRQCSHCWKNGL